MDIKTVHETAFTMPLTSPAYPPDPYHFIHHEFFIVTYRTDPAKLRVMVPEPFEVPEPLVTYEFIRMADSTGFGDYTKSDQVIPVTYEGKSGTYTLVMYLDDHLPLAGGREMWGFSKKLASPRLLTDGDTLIGTLDYGPVCVVTGTMGYEHRELDLTEQERRLERPSFLPKVIPHVDGKIARICELSCNVTIDIDTKGAWTGSASLELAHHALAPVTGLPVLEITEARYIVADLTLGMGEVVSDYLAQQYLPKAILTPVTANPRSMHISDLKGKVAVVAEAASGIDKQIALTLANSGAAIAIVDLNENGARAATKEIIDAGGKTIGLRMDVTDEQAVDSGINRVAGELGSIDILASNAGIQIVNPLMSYSFADWKKIQAIHVDGAFLTTRAALRHMYRDDRGGVVIYMDPVCSHEGSPLKSAYVAAKHALLSLNRALAKEGATHNVRSHVVYPGFVRTPLVEEQIPEQVKELGISEEDVAKKAMLGDTMDGVLTTVEDVAEMARFLTTFPSVTLTGQPFVVSHGWFMQ